MRTVLLSRYIVTSKKRPYKFLWRGNRMTWKPPKPCCWHSCYISLVIFQVYYTPFWSAKASKWMTYGLGFSLLFVHSSPVAAILSYTLYVPEGSATPSASSGKTPVERVLCRKSKKKERSESSNRRNLQLLVLSRWIQFIPKEMFRPALRREKTMKQSF